VAAAEKERLEANKVSATRVIEENRRIGFNDPRRFIGADGNLKPIPEWTDEMAAAVSKIEVVKRGKSSAQRSGSNGRAFGCIDLVFRQDRHDEGAA